VLAPLGRRVGVSTATVYGGVSIGRQIDRVRDADLVVATPGRLIDLMERGACRLGGIEITVIDEADHMSDLGFLPAVTRILDATPPGGQRMLFSATLDRGVGQLVTSYVSDPALHAVPAAVDSSLAEHRMLVLSAQDKVPVATEMASREGRTLFFVRTKHGADRLAKQLGRAGISAAAIHPGRVRRRGSAGPGRHRRRRPRHPRRRRRPRRAVRPAERRQGLPAPLGAHGPGRGLGPGGGAGRARAGP
jgi:superfamily II DNA/RNA helicase